MLLQDLVRVFVGRFARDAKLAISDELLRRMPLSMANQS